MRLSLRDSAVEFADIEREQELVRVASVYAAQFRRDPRDSPEIVEARARVVSSGVVDHARAFPEQDARVSLELATAGVEANSEMARAVAQAQFEQSALMGRAHLARAKGLQRRRTSRPTFDESGRFAGDPALTADQNDLMVRWYDQQIEDGADPEALNDAIEAGDVNLTGLGGLLDQSDEHFAPYRELHSLLTSDGDPNVRGQVALDAMFSLPRAAVVDIVNQTKAGAGVDAGFESSVAAQAGGLLRDHLAGTYGRKWDESAEFDLDEGMSKEKLELERRLRDAAVARGEDPGPISTVVGKTYDGGGSVLGRVTRPLIGAAGFGPQSLTNSFRQNVNDLGSGINAGAGNAAFGGGGGDPLRRPGQGLNASPLSAEATSAASAAGGYVGLQQDIAQTALTVAPLASVSRAAGGSFAGLGRAGRAATALGPDVLEAGLTPGGATTRQREAFGATDLGVMMSDPELAGDGILLSSDAIQLRQDRERAFTPTNDAGEFLTFGRFGAMALGLDPETQPYRVLSGMVDFSVAVAGPGEFVGDEAIYAARNLRRVPGVRSVPLLGKFDPLAEAGGITSRWRNTVLPQRVEDWVDGWRGRAVVTRLSELSTVPEVKRAFGNRGIDTATAAIIADIEDPSTIAEILKKTMGVRSVSSTGEVRHVSGVPQLGRVTGFLGNVRHVDTFGSRVLRGNFGYMNRIASELPTGTFNLDSLDDAYGYSANYLANAGFSQKAADEILDGLARTSALSRGGYFLREVAGAVEEELLFSNIARREWGITSATSRAVGEEGATVSSILAGTSELTGKNLERATAAAKYVRNLTRHHVELTEDLNRFNVDAMGVGVPSPFMTNLDGTVSRVPRPDLLLEHARGVMSGPDILSLRGIRRTNSPFYNMMSQVPLGGALEETINGLRYIPEVLTSLWKPLVLLRPAYIMRVVAEEQTRIAAAGGDSIVNNPIGWLIWGITGKHSRGLQAGARGMDIKGALTRESAGWRGVQIGNPDQRSLYRGPVRAVKESLERDRALRSFEAKTYSLADPSMRNVDLPGSHPDNVYVRAWAGEIGALTQDPLARAVAASDGVTDQLVDDVLADDVLRQVLDDLGQANPNTVTGEALRLRNAPNRPWSKAEEAEYRSAVRELLEHRDARIRNKLSGPDGTGQQNLELRQGIADGKFRDIAIADPKAPNLSAATDEFADELAFYVDEFGPTQVKSVGTVRDAASSGASFRGLRVALDVLGGAIIENPSSRLSRSPVYNQEYWSFVDTHAANMTPEAARRVLDNLDKVELPKGTAAELANMTAEAGDLDGLASRIETLYPMLDRPTAEAIAGTTDVKAIEEILVRGKGLPAPLDARVRNNLNAALKGGGTMDLDGFDLAAQAYAMERTNDLLFSMLTKQQWSDSLRIIAPFAEAWAEIIQTWGRLATQNPGISRRLQQTSNVVGDADFAQSLTAIPGWEVIDGEGLIHTDDYGNEVIVVPWANAAGDMLAFAQKGDIASAIARPFTGDSGPSGIERTPQTTPLRSINVAAGVIPGIGPFVSIPLSHFLPEKAKSSALPGLLQPALGDEVRDVLWPYGEPASMFSWGAVEGVAPAWARYAFRVVQGDDLESLSVKDRNAYEGRVAAAAQYILANDYDGEYDVQGGGDPEINRLMEKARELAHEVALSQVVGALGGPSTTQQTWLIKDEDGNVQMNLADENANTFLSLGAAGSLFREFLDEASDAGMTYEDAERAAFLKLVEATGSPGSIYATLGKSVARTPGGAPTSRAAWDWLQENPEVEEDATTNLTWGFFAPDDGDFYGPMYARTIFNEDRQRLSERDTAKAMSGMAGDILYANELAAAEEALGDYDSKDFPEAARVALKLWAREEIAPKFEGWRDPVVDLEGNPAAAINELEVNTAEGGLFADHPFAAPIQEILTERGNLLEAVVKATGSTAEVPWGSRSDLRGLRQAWSAWLDEKEAETPELGRLINRVFRAEMRSGLESDLKE